MKYKDGKPVSHPDKNSRVPMAMMFVVLCGLSFYLGGIFCSEKDKIETTDVAEVVSSPRESSVAPLQIKSAAFPECSSDYQDYTPCTDPRRWKRYGNHRLTFMERHCPPVFERKECLVPPPDGYKPPITWPKSRDQCWYRNVPYDWIDKQKSNQHWLRKEGEKFLFPGGGTMFPRGVGAYVDLMQDLIPEMKDGTIRSAIDTGCGVKFGGIYLLEVHRILRPGGFWVLSGPPVNYENRWRGWNTTVEEQKSDYEKLQELLTSMCFKLYDKKDDIAVWQKASDNSCYSKLTYPDAYPPKCDDSLEPDSAWYTPLRPCVVVPSPRIKKSVMESIPKWPERLHATPERILDVHGGSASAFKHDDSKWKIRAKHYKKLLPALGCEAFSTYPRTYDLLHLDGLFTAESHRCDMKYVLLEMDRILRPAGYAIIRESSYFADAISTIARGMRWSCRREDTEYGVEKERILICQKKLWHSSNQSSR
ncbi:S-ADENOSYL-L-METHIONINE-DEPENDENT METHYLTRANSFERASE-RELATED [Salix purpurea]|uniref:Methyltransferase n=1 Tax=Salix purpurea TaxID=77065 RepID=A0A9Q0QFS5_SALPP|nr:S-ADENOSYL-L-METHIONINE-DEPENDENT METHYLTRANSFERASE-RELATED [Salix purpurea]KAJ6705863.1 S-ADENOSYL-L-METHIONINE-DEPENDENT METHYLTRANSFERASE-RELATED [Salix purpurea]